jgi:hypothetical protein
MEAILICVVIWLAIFLVDKALAVRADLALERLRWAADHPEEYRAQLEAELRAELAGLIECGLSEAEALDFVRLRLLAELQEWAEAPC